MPAPHHPARPPAKPAQWFVFGAWVSDVTAVTEAGTFCGFRARATRCIMCAADPLLPLFSDRCRLRLDCSRGAASCDLDPLGR